MIGRDRTASMVITLGLLFVFASPSSRADEKGLRDQFEEKVRPVLVERCYPCHSVEAGKSKGGLMLDSRQAVRDGGDSGPAVVPGKPDESLLLRAIEHANDIEPMPPKAKLPDPVIADRPQRYRNPTARLDR
jgi:hypothetical protein